MRALKDVYIKVTKDNVKELNLLLKKLVIEGDNLLFESESIESVYIDEPKNKQKVTLSELKRLIDTILTREEITRLKRQISAYKMNLSLVNESCKELHSDNDILVDNMEKLDDKLEAAEKENKQLNEMYDELVVESGKKHNLLKNLYDDALKKIDSISYEKSFLSSQYYVLKEENEQLKQRKWYQFW